MDDEREEKKEIQHEEPSNELHQHPEDENLGNSVHPKQEHDSDKKNSMTDKMRENPWMLSTFALGLLALILIFGNLGGGMTGNIVSEEIVGANFVEFAEPQVGPVTILDVTSENGLYKISFNSDETGKSEIYSTLNGDFLISGLIPVSINTIPSFLDSQTDSSPTTTSKTDFSEEDNNKIQEFSQCIADEGFRVYAADWCPHCEDMKESFGGLTNVEPFWIVCSDASRQPTENAELCAEEEIKGFPTMKLSGEVLNIPRTFEAIAEATGCSAPQLS